MKKNRLLLCLLMLAAYFAASAQNQVAPSGDGSQNNPYKIATLENLYWMAINVNGWNQMFEGKYLVQTADIDASATATWNNGAGWQPVGDSLQFHFKGNYDGQGHTISGLTMNRPTRNCAGLFGYTEKGYIRNLGLVGVSIKAQHASAALVGYSFSKINNCYATGSVSGSKYAGGLVGVNNDTIIQSYSACTVAGDLESGGFAGASLKLIDQCFATGNVSGTATIGGFIGTSGSVITNCYSKGSVTRTSGTNSVFGAFAGYSDNNIRKSYATGAVKYATGTQPTAKGFLGNGYNYTANCFFDSITTAQTSNNGATPKTTAEMTTGHTFAIVKWDMLGYGEKGIWNIGNGRNGGYPYHAWQFPADPEQVYDIDAAVSSATVKYSGGSAAILSAKITDVGSPRAVQHGFCWKRSTMPTIADAKIELGMPANIDFTANIINFPVNTTIYIRPFVTTSRGTFYGDEVSLICYSLPQGSGTANDPYLISNLYELYWLERQVNEAKNTFAGNYIRQTADIDASPIATWFATRGWQPIGSNTVKFGGVYDGGGFAIDRLYIKGYDLCGLFGRIESSTLKNIRLTNANINCSGWSGALVGHAAVSSVLSNCSVSGSVTGISSSYIGGLAGMIQSGTLIENSSSSCTVKGGNNIGGLAGLISSSTVRSCFSTGTVTGGSNVGGLAGRFDGSGNTSYLITQSYSTATVNGSDNVGGLIGNLGTVTTVSQCYSTGAVNAVSTAGGFAGTNSGIITDCYTHSTVNRISGTDAVFGGFIGSSSSSVSISNCYATGAVTYAGSTNPTDKGFASVSTSDKYAHDFWDMNTSCQNATGVLLAKGKTTDQMKDIATFTSEAWDFKTIGSHGIWNIGNARNEGYPYFVWQYPADALGQATVPPSVTAPEIVSISGKGAADISTDLTCIGIPRASVFGICWNMTGNPSIADNKVSVTVNNNGIDTFALTGLANNTVYYARAFVTSASGTVYSAEVSFMSFTVPAGTGTEADPYLIADLGNLYWLQYLVNIKKVETKGMFFRQTAAIDASATRTWNNGEGWLPIGAGFKGLSGTYNGGGFAVNGLYINRPSTDHVGLFADISMYAKVSNLGVTNADITGRDYVGAFSGMIRFSTVTNCYVTGSVKGKNTVGGLTGECHYSNVYWSNADVSVAGESFCGGFVGRCFMVQEFIENCYSLGTVTRTGGSSAYLGGFIGMVSDADISNCYSTGKVIYANGVSPTDKGFCGEAQLGYATFNGNLWDIQASAQSTNSFANAAQGMPTKYMKQMAMYQSKGWSFTQSTTSAYWKIDPARNNGYPYHSWQVLVDMPELVTLVASSAGTAGFTANGNLTKLGATNPTAYGFCYNTTGTPSLANGTVANLGAAAAIGTFSAQIKNLDPCYTYYVRAFATVAAGTVYGETMKVTLVDNISPMVTKLGNQIIYAEDLQVGAPLPNYIKMVTIADNCPESMIEIFQSPAPGTIITAATQVWVVAVDPAKNSDNTEFTVSVVATPSISVQLAEGWNIISTNIHPADSSIEALFDGLDVLEIKNQDHYWSKNQNAMFNSLTKITAGEGYLVRMNTKGTLKIVGKQMVPNIQKMIPQSTVNWQLVGCPFASAKAFADVYPPASCSAVKDFKGVWSPGAQGNSIDTFEPGKAYFIKK